MSKNSKQYFSRYAENEVEVLAKHQSFLPDEFSVEHVLVIPAYQENSVFIERFLASALVSKPVLLVLVVNEPKTKVKKVNTDTAVAVENNQQKQLYQYAVSCGKIFWQYENLTLVKTLHSQAWILVIDRFTQAIDSEQGVGLARKIGCDLSAYLMSIDRIKQPWICSSDADAYLPNDYFSTLATRRKNTVVCCFNFQHSCEDKTIHQANFLYETALRYYVAGLRYAHSPYAFFTIGSILVFKAEAYIQARGFPKRSAGEDFYLLNKLAKLGEVEFIADVVIKLEARVSERVPFGTGPAVQKILDLQSSEHDYCYYHPNIFIELKNTLLSFSTLWQHRNNLMLWQKSLSAPAHLALTELCFESFIQKQKNSNEKQFNKQLIVWFDAFKTLKFIHSMRANYYPDIPLSQALSEAPF
jgi:hypothetical protein